MVKLIEKDGGEMSTIFSKARVQLVKRNHLIKKLERW